MVLSWPGHPSGAVAAAGAMPCSWEGLREIPAQLRNRNFGGDARFAKAFMILLPSIVGDLGIVGVFGLKTLP